MPSWFLIHTNHLAVHALMIRHDMLHLMSHNTFEDVICLISKVFASSYLICWVVTAESGNTVPNLVVSLFLICNIHYEILSFIKIHSCWWPLGDFCHLQTIWGENVCYSAKPEVTARAGKLSRHWSWINGAVCDLFL